VISFICDSCGSAHTTSSDLKTVRVDDELDDVCFTCWWKFKDWLRLQNELKEKK